VKELSAPFKISAPAITKHVKVLERAGLITRSRDAQWRPCRLDPKPLKGATDWLEQYRQSEKSRWIAWKITWTNCKQRRLQSMTATTSNTPVAGREIVLRRVLNAPRNLGWTAYTDPKHVPNWWGPRGFTITLHEMDVRPGGVWRFMMHGPDGANYPNKVEYIEMVKPERLVFLHGGDEEGDVGKFHVTVTFCELGAQAEVVSRMVFNTVEQREETVKFGAIELGNQTFDRLSEYLAAGMTRITH
jgi:uncharacterized protein YndB with AHSA1/START domain